MRVNNSEGQLVVASSAVSLVISSFAFFCLIRAHLRSKALPHGKFITIGMYVGTVVSVASAASRLGLPDPKRCGAATVLTVVGFVLTAAPLWLKCLRLLAVFRDPRVRSSLFRERRFLYHYAGHVVVVAAVAVGVTLARPDQVKRVLLSPLQVEMLCASNDFDATSFVIIFAMFFYLCIALVALAVVRHLGEYFNEASNNLFYAVSRPVFFSYSDPDVHDAMRICVIISWPYARFCIFQESASLHRVLSDFMLRTKLPLFKLRFGPLEDISKASESSGSTGYSIIIDGGLEDVKVDE
jgi:hypothetical protein